MKNGNYVLVIAPNEYPGKIYRNKYCYEHHLVWWINTGEYFGKEEGYIIHHKNENKKDNRFENLEKLTNIVHSRKHGQEISLRSRKYCICPNCGIEFIKRKRPIQIFCSRKCIGLYNHRKRKNSSVV